MNNVKNRTQTGKFFTNLSFDIWQCMLYTNIAT